MCGTTVPVLCGNWLLLKLDFPNNTFGKCDLFVRSHVRPDGALAIAETCMTRKGCSYIAYQGRLAG